MRKYRNRKVTLDGRVFDSRKEAKRYQELKLLEAAGEISDLQTQVKFVLIPSQREPGEPYKMGPLKGQRKPGRVVEREVAYFADFAYCNKQGRRVVEDTKGLKTKDYIIKRKMMLYFYGVRIHEI